ncbi:MAG: hypothetical protein ABR555_05770 [Pyrinomonadaceae bacterium]
MRGLLITLKKVFFWKYARNTWQWDLLCVVILIFIFLSPKSWFSSGELPPSAEHQSRTTATVLLTPEVVANEKDKDQIQQQVRTQTGLLDAEVIAVRKVVDQQGRTIRFEVDIR